MKTTFQLILTSDEYGEEVFDDYETVHALMAAARRLVESSRNHTAKDGFRRLVAIIIEADSDEDEDPTFVPITDEPREVSDGMVI